jgi:hypothetical protein
MPKTVSFYWVLGFAAFTLACQPDIGDSCALHSDCSQTGDRICDPTFPGGYCTIFNCEPGTCPSEAVCVAFYTTPSERQECADPTDRRLERTFCMKTCTGNGDCRGGYDCKDYARADNNGVEAVVVERGSYNPRVCTIAPPNRTASVDAGSVNVCSAAEVSSGDSGGGARDGGRDGSSFPDASAEDGAISDGAPHDARGGS